MSRLWYVRPAEVWEEALPVGNGRLGGMVFGGVERERIQLNEESMWYGKPQVRENPDALANLKKIRELIFAGKIRQAETLMEMALSGCPNTERPYQTLGDLYIMFDPAEANGGDAAQDGSGGSGEMDLLESCSEGSGELCSDYSRELDLENALCTTVFKRGGVHYRREVLASCPDDCIAIMITADRKGAVNFRARMERDRFVDGAKALGPDMIVLYGTLGEGGTSFATLLRAVVKGGSVRTIGEHLVVSEADEAVLYLTACTNFREVKEGEPDPKRSSRIISQLISRAALILDQAAKRSFAELKEHHIADYRRLYGEVKLELGGTDRDDLPTDQRLKRRIDDDTVLSKLLFDFGRYLLISCSRKGNLPANLQGIWNCEYLPPWDSKYTVNINAEMNYWPAEVCGLGECHEAFLDFIPTLVKQGRRTARVMYGCRGWVMHHNTDAFGDTAPQDIYIPATYWVLGSAWVCTHLWKHYAYSRDRAFLRRVFPVMLEAALFYLDFLVEKDGFLVTCPSVSPENTYILPGGEKGAISYGVTMDNQILRDLFGECIAAYEVLKCEGAPKNQQMPARISKALQNTEEASGELRMYQCFEADLREMEVTISPPELLEKIREAYGKLAPTRIGSDGRIMEWIEEYGEAEPGHRHISHLYGLFPSDQISMRKTPDLANAARKTLETRLRLGGGHTGWSRAWIINLYARLWDGEGAYRNIRAMLEQSTYPNLFDRHPPFQIDGNFGVVSAIAEMLVQSDEESVTLLPALPKQWESGSVSGLRVVGGGRIFVSWRKGVLCAWGLDVDEPMERSVYYKNKKIHMVFPVGETRRYFDEETCI